MGFRNAAVVVEYKCEFNGIVVEWRGGGKEEVERRMYRGSIDGVSWVFNMEVFGDGGEL